MSPGVPVHRDLKKKNLIYIFFNREDFSTFLAVNWSSQLKNPTLMLMSAKLPQ